MTGKIQDVNVTDIAIWPVRDPQASRVKAMVNITFNDCLRVSGCRIIEGAQGLFLSFPSQKKPGTDTFVPLFYPINRHFAEDLQNKVIKRFKEITNG